MKLKIYKINAANSKGLFVAFIQAASPKIAAAKVRAQGATQIFSIK